MANDYTHDAPAMGKVLVVDDEAGIRDLIMTTLASATPFNVSWAANGVDALAVARRELPDLVLLDVNIPEPDGVEVCRQIKSGADTGGATVVMLSAMTDAKSRAKAMASGADLYLTKPFSPKSLIVLVRVVMENGGAISTEDEAEALVPQLAIVPDQPHAGDRSEGAQLELYARDLSAALEHERGLRADVDNRVRELEALNKLFMQHMDAQVASLSVYPLVVEQLRAMANQIESLYDSLAELPSLPGVAVPGRAA
jgi:DNA-binding response OmpR family regulator